MVPSIGSLFASALQRMLILNHAEHHNHLEDQAQQYEAAGRKEIARLIRQHAQQLTLDRPLPLSDQVLAEFGAESPALFNASSSTSLLPLTQSPKRNKTRRSDADVTTDGEESA